MVAERNNDTADFFEQHNVETMSAHRIQCEHPATKRKCQCNNSFNCYAINEFIVAIGVSTEREMRQTSSSSSNRPLPPLKRPLFPPKGEKSSLSTFGGLNMSSLSSSAVKKHVIY